MAASSSPAAPMSDVDPLPSSPGRGHLEKSFMTAATEDDNDSKMANATPEPSEKHPRGKKRGRAADRDDRDNPNANVVGKIRHLKKEDGEPLWRSDIQYDFLRAVFDNEKKVFTNSYDRETPRKQCFADLYIDTMARSTKTSKVLHDKLLSDREAAKGMAMVCLLVNIGRMNTTLNFFPEMRAQLRTYHAIPSLQAHQDAHAYKQLQDAPRLKSILKGGAEDRGEPNTLEDIKAKPVPRTNPVNLLFVICQSAAKIAELHFPPGREFHDLIMRTNVSSQSRANAFLWLMWFYLESDFTEEGCEENPFGPGVDYGVDLANQGVPRLLELGPGEDELENQDTPEEIQFGEDKKKMRAKILEADQQFLADTQNKRGARGRVYPGEEASPANGILPRIRPAKHESDMDSVRSTPPPRGALKSASGAAGSSYRRPAGVKYHMYEGSSPSGSHHADKQPLVEGVLPRKPRPPTAHQLAVERNRAQRIDYILDQGIRRSHHRSRKVRRADGSMARTLKRLRKIEWPFVDSEDEDEAIRARSGQHWAPPINHAILDASYDTDKPFPFRERGYGGLCQLKDEEDDFGEEVASYGAALRRAERRLRRWEESNDPDPGVVRPVKRLRANVPDRNDDDGFDDDGLDDDMGSPSKDQSMLLENAETEDEAEAEAEAEALARQAVSRRRGGTKPGRGKRASTASRHNGSRENGDSATPMALDDDDDLNDVEKSLLGMAGDEEGEGEGAGDEDEDELDGMEKTLLGIGGDSDSE